MVRLDSKANSICAGISCILFIIAFTLFFYDSLPRGSHEFAMYVLGAHLISSICLTVGAIKDKYKLFVPWMITTLFFMYIMLLAVLNSSRYIIQMDFFTMIAIIVAFSVYHCFALYGVQKAFEAMRKMEPPSYNNLNDKANVANHI